MSLLLACINLAISQSIHYQVSLEFSIDPVMMSTSESRSAKLVVLKLATMTCLEHMLTNFKIFFPNMQKILPTNFFLLILLLAKFMLFAKIAKLHANTH